MSARDRDGLHFRQRYRLSKRCRGKWQHLRLYVDGTQGMPHMDCGRQGSGSTIHGRGRFGRRQKRNQVEICGGIRKALPVCVKARHRTGMRENQTTQVMGRGLGFRGMIDWIG